MSSGVCEAHVAMVAGKPVRVLDPNGWMNNWILKQFPNDYLGYAVDVGASDGVSCNSTLLMEKLYRWNVLSVEANPLFEPVLRHFRAFVEITACAAAPAASATFHVHDANPEAHSALVPRRHPYEGQYPIGTAWHTIQVKVETVDRLLAKWQFPRLDALCLDVEGGEAEVLRGANLARWQPHVIVVECWHDAIHDDYLRPFGYQRVMRSAHNTGYILNPEAQ